MNDNFSKTIVSDGVNNRNVCYVLLTKFESVDNLESELSVLRKSFFVSLGKRQVLREKFEYLGYPTTVTGIMNSSSLKYKKIVNDKIVEESVKNSRTFTVHQNTLNGILTSKIHYSSDMRWTKTEYFVNGVFDIATYILKPHLGDDGIEYFAYNEKNKNYSSHVYYPVPYEKGSEVLKMMNEKFGEPEIYVEYDDGTYLYCKKKEQVLRLEFIKSKEETEIADIADEDILSFEQDEIGYDELDDSDLTLEVENINHDEIEGLYVSHENADNLEIAKMSNATNFTGKVFSGKPEGRGRLEQENGMTIFDGTFEKGIKQGFGCLYNEKSEFKFAGLWKDDKKHGTGVSFRESDQSIHISNWIDGEPDERVSLFDQDANLRFVGKIVDGRKQGAGINYDKESKKLVVYKYDSESQTPTMATIFDELGNLIYVGGYINGMREGEGTEYDVNGVVTYKGLFKNDEYSSGTIYKKITEE